MAGTRCHGETQTGEPCQNTPQSNGYCHLHQDQSQPAKGRKRKLTPNRIDPMLQAARIGTTMQGIARAGGIDESTLYDWINRENEGPPFSEFSKKLKQARSQGEQRLIARVHEKKPEFLLERSYGYMKTQELRHTGPDGGSVKVFEVDDDWPEQGEGDA